WYVCRDDCHAQRHGDVAGGGVQRPTAARRGVIAQHRALLWLAADLAHPRNRTVAPRHHRNTHLSRRGRVQRLGLARPVLVLFPADVRRLLYPGAFSSAPIIKFVLIATIIVFGEGVV